MRRAGWLSAALLLTACAPAAPPRTAAGGATAPPPAPASAAPWEIPADDLGTQRLYRVHYEGPEGEGGVKVTLRLVAADRYQAQAADPLGRPLWSLEVDGDRGLWLDHRESLACRLAGGLELAGLPLSPFPLPSLPPLLLGRLPAAPATPDARRAAAAPGAGAADFADAAGRRWTARLAAGRPLSWALWGPTREGTTDAGAPAITWLAAGAESVLSDRGRGMQLRWRLVVSERLAGEPAPLAVPPDYREGACRGGE